MAKKVIRITESELRKLVESVLKEDSVNLAYDANKQSKLDSAQQARINSIANTYSSVKKVGNDFIIQNPSSSLNNTKWVDYLTKYNITSQEIEAAKKAIAVGKKVQDTQNQRYQNISNMYSAVDQDGMIRNPKSSYNGKPWSQFIKDFKVTQDEINKAQAYVKSKTPAPTTGTTTGSMATVTGSTVTTQKKPAVSTDNIKKVQTMLKSKGFDIGTSGPNKDGVDGMWGTKTQTAYKAYKSGTKPTQSKVDTSMKLSSLSPDDTPPGQEGSIYNMDGTLKK